MLRVSMAIAAMFGATATAEAATVIPTVYEAGHFFATPTTKEGKTLRLLVDTGGGGYNYWITEAAAKRLALKPVACGEGSFVEAPHYRPGSALPKPTAHCGAIGAIGGAEVASLTSYDGMIGSSYLPQHIWTFDYPARTLSVEDSTWKPPANAHPLTMGFPPHEQKFPRITVTIAGESVDLLLDTGATALPTKEGAAATQTRTVNGEGVASYITTSVMDRWHAQHPDWKVVDHADALLGPAFRNRMIRVPSLEIAGWEVHDVWFTERPNPNFDAFMSGMMDKHVDGALGANVFRSFRMTLDYSKAKAWLSCVDACTAVKK